MIDEVLFAGYLKKRPIELVKATTCDIKVPAHAEFILEGYVDLEEERLEGPFGDHTGYYSLADMYPVFHLTKSHAKTPHLSYNHCWQATDGGLLSWQSNGAYFPSSHENSMS